VTCFLVLLTFYLWGIKQASKMITLKHKENAEALLAAAEDPNSSAAPIS